MIRFAGVGVPTEPRIVNDAGTLNLPVKPRPFKFTWNIPRVASLLFIINIAESVVALGWYVTVTVEIARGARLKVLEVVMLKAEPGCEMVRLPIRFPGLPAFLMIKFFVVGG